MPSTDPFSGKPPHPASSLHYALHLVPASRRPHAQAWLAWCREVQAIPGAVHDPGVAGTKLAWWQREVQEALAGQAHHPVLRSLVQPGPGAPLRAGDFLAVIEGTRIDLEQTRYLDAAALAAYLDRAGGGVATGLVRLLAEDEADAHAMEPAARSLGHGALRVRLLRDTGLHARAGRLYLPVAELQRHDVKAHEILRQEAPWAYGERYLALMSSQAELAERDIAAPVDALSRAQRRRLGPLAAWGAMHRALLDAMRTQDYPVLHQRLALSPLRKLWIATRIGWLGG